jgi:hypothetical protein
MLFPSAAPVKTAIPTPKAMQMKTTLLSLLALGTALTTTKLHGQGTVLLNNYDSGMGIYLPDYNAAPAPAGSFFEVLAGPSALTMTPLLTSIGIGPIFSILPGGVEAQGPGSGSYFDVGYGFVPGVPSGGTGYFQVFA